MQDLTQAIKGWSDDRLAGMRRGVEKESLRTRADGHLASTGHPTALGSALTHPHITTDFSESQVELITGVHPSAQACAAELDAVQTFTLNAIGDELLWPSSMPCWLPGDDEIPLGQYGTSNVGRSKTVYRSGLGYRYGRRMQTISGVHYNWSIPQVADADYFSLIRNFRRHAFLPMVLFGASPAVCACFARGNVHTLQALGDDTLYLPYATSLRMGGLGYQSDAQSALAVSYNSLEGYGRSIEAALTVPYPRYEAIGVRSEDGSYRQLGTSLLQIENEFYGTIRPKRTIHPGERPLHALRERGVQYVEVRLMDLDPFEPIGIATQTMRFLDVFLLHCLLSDSPPDTPHEIAALVRNQGQVAERGREPGFCIERQGQQVELVEWADRILSEMRPIAERLDAVNDKERLPAPGLHCAALDHAIDTLHHPEKLPAARVLASMQNDFGGSFGRFGLAQAQRLKASAVAAPLTAAQTLAMKAQALQSLHDQAAVEAADSLPFDQYLVQYLSPARLTPRSAQRRA